MRNVSGVPIHISIQTGILSKSRGQVLRLTAVMHMLFNIDNVDQPLEEEVGELAVKAAVNFIQLACQQTAFIAGKGTLQEEMDKFKAGNYDLSSHIHE